jgi:hypothetical protein
MLDAAFHSQLAVMSGNLEAVRQLKRIFEHTRLRSPVELIPPSRMNVATAEHAQILRLIREQNVSGATVLVAKHIQEAKEARMEMLASLPSMHMRGGAPLPGRSAQRDPCRKTATGAGRPCEGGRPRIHEHQRTLIYQQPLAMAGRPGPRQRATVRALLGSGTETPFYILAPSIERTETFTPFVHGCGPTKSGSTPEENDPAPLSLLTQVHARFSRSFAKQADGMGKEYRRPEPSQPLGPRSCVRSGRVASTARPGELPNLPLGQSSERIAGVETGTAGSGVRAAQKRDQEGLVPKSSQVRVRSLHQPHRASPGAKRLLSPLMKRRRPSIKRRLSHGHAAPGIRCWI